MKQQTESKVAFAARIGVSKSRISQLLKDGLPITPGGRIPVAAGSRWYAQHIRHSTLRPGPGDAGKRLAAAEARRSREMAETNWPDTDTTNMRTHNGGADTRPDAPDKPESFLEAQARKESATADLRELELAKRRGELVEVAEVKSFLGGMITAARNRLLGIGSKLGPDLAQEPDAINCQAMIDLEIREALDELKEYRQDSAASPTC